MAQYGTANFTDQDLQAWFANPANNNPAAIAQAAAQHGMTATDISNAMRIGTGGATDMAGISVRNYVTDPANSGLLGGNYSWNPTTGALNSGTATQNPVTQNPVTQNPDGTAAQVGGSFSYTPTSTTPVTATPTSTAQINVATANPILQPGTSTYTASTPAAATITPATNYTATNPTTATIAPTTQWNVTPDQLASNRLNQIIATDNPLMQRAASQALQGANSRGLLNSSMAQGAAQAAVIDAALPMAQQEANAYAEAARFTAQAENARALGNAELAQQASLAAADAQNRAKEFGAQAENVRASQNAQYQQAANLAGAELQSQAAQFGAQQQNASNLAYSQINANIAAQNANALNAAVMNQLDAENRVQLANIQATYSTQLQASQTAGSLYNQTMSMINNIQQSTAMDTAAKTAATTQAVDLLNAGLSLQGAITNLDISNVLDFTA